ncbi:conserved protein of unknown function [Bradyrhizobium vignae]|uniref:Transposase n=1 Tax=Bradyrhizobium vignae TaxID=1549949 RepID=A0A2U3Q1J7_9BRAD|nr:conserved protein of unknown function [Bradyrhizobium vignae]
MQGLRARTRQGREWMMTQDDLVVVGIDVAKDKIDACIRTVTERQAAATSGYGPRRCAKQGWKYGSSIPNGFATLRNRRDALRKMTRSTRR